MLGLVTITAATSGAELGREVGEVDAAVGGLGDLHRPDSRPGRRWPGWCRGRRSGPARVRRASPRASCAARMASRPQSSPWAPALGDSATAGMPVRVFSQWASWSISASAPCTVDCGCSGWMSAKPARRAIFSFRRGLCFIVHEPSG